MIHFRLMAVVNVVELIEATMATGERRYRQSIHRYSHGEDLRASTRGECLEAERKVLEAMYTLVVIAEHLAEVQAARLDG
jgi:hypothetical protein